MDQQISKSKILIIDRKDSIQSNYEHLLDSIGRAFFNIQTAFSVEEAFQPLMSDQVDIVLLDVNMVNPFNRHILDIVRHNKPEIRIITVGSLSDRLNGRVDNETFEEHYDQSQGIFSLLTKIKKVLNINKS